MVLHFVGKFHDPRSHGTHWHPNIELQKHVGADLKMRSFFFIPGKLTLLDLRGFCTTAAICKHTTCKTVTKSLNKRTIKHVPSLWAASYSWWCIYSSVPCTFQVIFVVHLSVSWDHSLPVEQNKTSSWNQHIRLLEFNVPIIQDLHKLYIIWEHHKQFTWPEWLLQVAHVECSEIEPSVDLEN